VEALETVCGEFDGACNGVHCPTQDGFSGGPCSIALEKFLGGNWLFPNGAVGGLQWAENLVYAVKERATGHVKAGTGELGGGDEIVHINVREDKWWC
jgi:hypothetical protein